MEKQFLSQLVVFTALPIHGIQKLLVPKIRVFFFYFFFQVIYLKFVSVASDHFSFEATFETMVDPQFLQQPDQGSSHLLVFLKDILALLLRFSGL